jgi:FkbM family methyltransferase
MVFKRIKVVKNLFLEKLDTSLSKLDDLEQMLRQLTKNNKSLLKRNSSLLENNSYLLENNQFLLAKLELLEKIVVELTENDNLSLKSSIYIIELLQKVFPEIQQQYHSLLAEARREIEQKHGSLFYQVKGEIQDQHHDLLSQVKGEIQYQHHKLEEELQEKYNTLLDNSGLRVKVENRSEPGLDPEEKLISFLYSFLPSRNAIDIGANRGDVSESLLKVGYQVYAFEPYPPVFNQLCDRLKLNQDFHPYNFAIGSHDTTMDFHICSDESEGQTFNNPSLYNTLFPHSMPEGLKFTETLQVPVRSLESLHQTGEIPTDIGLVKIDTEGYDLEVIQGMGKARYPVAIAEFWDKQHIFGQSGTLNQLEFLVEAMKQRDYHWYLVISRVDKPSDLNFNYEIFFYGNYPKTVETSWGNVFFFREYEVFKQAFSWCSAFIPLVYFR